MTFGDRLRRERISAGMSQRDLATSAGVTQAAVWNLESGRQGVTMATAERFAKALGAAVSDLLLEGPTLFEVEFCVGELKPTAPPPWLERGLLAHVPEPARGRVAVWPYHGDGVLRLRARASTLPVLASLAGEQVENISPILPAPVVRPVQESSDLTVLIRAQSKAGARDDLDGRLMAADCSPRVRIDEWSGMWRASLSRVPRRASLALQGLTLTSPIGLFVPA
jgi:transcriptional regulator with XRE-family HTH domain